MSRLSAGREALRRHRWFAATFALGFALRLVTMLGFPPAIWFGGDSASYLSTALRHAPGTSRLSGYGIMLLVLRPFHSFAAVTAVQHLLGLAMAVLTYALLRRYGLPGWGATLASVPVLLSAYQLGLEQEILPSAAFGFLVLLAVTLALWWPGGGLGEVAPPRQHGGGLRGVAPPRQHGGGLPGVAGWATVAAGVLLAISATFWPVGLPLLILFLLYLVLRRAGWRALAGTAAAATVPLGGYLLWFYGTYQHVAFTNSDGIYLWSRTMSFANCAVIKPPADEAALCPPRPAAPRQAASAYIWEPGSPLNGLPGKKFSPAKNALALDFALRAITAQPAAYATAVLHDFSLAFAWNIPSHPSAQMTWRYEFAHATSQWISPGYVLVPGHTVASDQRAYGGQTRTRAVRPFAGWLRSYQRFAYLRGTLLGVVLLTGLAGMVRSWRGSGIRRLSGWGGPGLLPWLASLTLLLIPVMTADYSQRYALIAVPTACLAAGLAFARAGSAYGRRARTSRITARTPPATAPSASTTHVTEIACADTSRNAAAPD